MLDNLQSHSLHDKLMKKFIMYKMVYGLKAILLVNILFLLID